MEDKEKTLKVMPGYVLCDIIKEDKKSPIILPDGSKQDLTRSYLVAEHVRFNPNETVHPDIKEGDVLLIDMSGQRFYPDDEHVIVRVADVIAVRR